MSLQSFAGDFARSTYGTLDQVFTKAQNAIENLNTLAGSLGNALVFGDFVGIDENGVAALETAIEGYRDGVVALIKELDDGIADVALKGKPQEATQEFTAAIKNLMSAYVQALNRSKDDVKLAYKNYIDNAASIASDIKTDAQAAEQAAQSIKFE